jgi:ADP-heptose:LPS heptosyltransferase
MTRTLVIQLGRLGDIIQTTPLLGDLAASGDQIDVLALRPQHEVLLGFPAVANIITIPESLKDLDDAIACGFPHGAIPAEAHELLAALRLPLYDRIVNASHAPLGSWLAAANPCSNPDAQFGGIIRDRECLYLGAASAYRIATLQFREQNLFNVVDLLRASPGVAPRVSHGNGGPRLYANRSAELPFALPAGRKIALNPGASEPARCWPAEDFARLAEALSAAGFVPLLVGAPSERPLGEKIQSIARVAIPNFAGCTSIPEMAALLAHCELLVSGDTGAAHLAAAVGTTVLGLYGATAWFAETAPYGDNHIVLQTPRNAPMSAISVAAALAAALNRLGRLSITDLRRELRSHNQFAWETSIQPARHASDPLCAQAPIDPLGGLVYRPLHRDSLTPEDHFAISLRRSFATEFVAAGNTSQPGSAGILAGSEAALTTSNTSPHHHPLAEILDHMERTATLCADSVRHHKSSADISTAASALIATMDKLRALATVKAVEKATNVATDNHWQRLSPVIHNLDWQLRMLPPQSPKASPEATFRSHAQAYASAARVLRNAAASQRKIATPNDVATPDASTRDEIISWKGRNATQKQSTRFGNLGIDGTGRKEGGQVPCSVRIQAPARRRGSVSP